MSGTIVTNRLRRADSGSTQTMPSRSLAAAGRRIGLWNPLYSVVMLCAAGISLSLILLFYPFTNALSLSDQPTTNTITIDRVSVSRGGYVVVTGIRYKGQERIDYLLSPYLVRGVYTHLIIPFQAVVALDGKTHVFEPIEPIPPENTLIAALYETPPIETRAFNLDTVSVAKNVFGRTVSQSFRVTLRWDVHAARARCRGFIHSEEAVRCMVFVMENAARRFIREPGLFLNYCSLFEPSTGASCYSSLVTVMYRWGMSKEHVLRVCDAIRPQTFISGCWNSVNEIFSHIRSSSSR